MTSRLVAEHVGSGMEEEEVAQGQMEKGRFGGVRSVCAPDGESVAGCDLCLCLG